MKIKNTATTVYKILQNIKVKWNNTLKYLYNMCICIYIHYWKIPWSSYRKFAWVGFEPTSFEFHYIYIYIYIYIYNIYIHVCIYIHIYGFKLLRCVLKMHVFSGILVLLLGETKSIPQIPVNFDKYLIKTPFV